MAASKTQAPRADDFEVVFASAFALVAVLLGAGPLILLTRSVEDGSSLLAAVAATKTVSAFYAVFVQLPVLVAFCGIGLPVLLGLLWRWRSQPPQRADAQRLLVLAACVLLYLVSGGVGAVAVAALVCALVCCGSGVAVGTAMRTYHGARWLLWLGAVGLFVLAFYEHRVWQGQPASFAVAPTGVVAAWTGAALALLIRTVAVAVAGAVGAVGGLLLGWGGLAAWILSPLAEQVLGSQAGPVVEVSATAGVGLILLIVSRWNLPTPTPTPALTWTPEVG